MTGWHEPAPGEHKARERVWDVVREAYDERISVPRRRDRRPFVLVAVAAAVLAAALSPPGQAVWGSLRDAVQNEDHLLSLPAPGRVLVNAQGGAWVVQRDGSKRFLRDYVNAAWSPHGLYLAAVRGNQLVAMEPNGNVHWKLARPQPVGGPQWSFDGYRIAYSSGRQLRVVNGDGTGDRIIVPNAGGSQLAAFTWRPGTHELVYNIGRDQLVLLDVDARRVLWRRRAAGVEQLLWSADGKRLLVASGNPQVLDPAGHVVATFPARNLLPAAFLPRSQSLALVTVQNRVSTVAIYSGLRYQHRRVVFSGAGLFGGIDWSPDGRWLLIDWRDADQWLFIRSAAVRRIAVRNIGNTFDSGPEHYATLGGWCCP
jgi:dipeptidyl aminopeptidase/acylaminoacyl peptidase